MAVKFGWKAGSEQYPPYQLLEYAVTAEQAGFDSIDVSAHFHPRSEHGGLFCLDVAGRRCRSYREDHPRDWSHLSAVGADTIRETVCISSDPEAHVKNARRYMELGFDHLIFHSAGPDQRPFLEAYGRQVLPRLRKLH